MKFLRKCILFYLGGTAYMILEFLWRGRSHASMFLLGGTCFLLLGKLYQGFRRICLPIKMLLGAAIITFLELFTGLLVNRNHTVWDYRKLPCQFRGQISLVYSLLWVPVSLVAMLLYHRAERIVKRGQQSRPR